MGTQPHAASSAKSSPCIARQPILTADENVFGYELLFRENQQDDHFTSDVENATGTTIETLNVIGLDVLCDGRRAFLNFTHHMLLEEYFSLLPPDEVVVEVQENIPVDEDVVKACQRLKLRGYAMALDNFVLGDAREELVPYADFIKVDTKDGTGPEVTAIAGRYASEQCRMVAQKVETRQDLSKAKRDGFTLFQGYFFRHPETMRARQIPANQATYLLLLQAISKPEADFLEIENLIKREPSLCYRLLRYLNSPLLGMSAPVSSVRHALNLLGERELVRWIRMATTLVVGREKSSDLVLASLVRARFCELLAPKMKHVESDVFLMGMLSLMDAILEVPIGVVIEKLSLEPNTKAQLLGGKTGAQTPLSPIYDLMVAREAGDWEKITNLGKKLNLSLAFMNSSYNEAMRWARQMTSSVPEHPAQKGTA
jgi:EAL and modified HD-GYP domain-containing signal transduction protein